MFVVGWRWRKREREDWELAFKGRAVGEYLWGLIQLGLGGLGAQVNVTLRVCGTKLLFGAPP